MRHLWLAWPVALLLSLVGCGRGQEPAPSDPLDEVFQRQAQEEGLSRSETEGKRVFVHYCATCHGDAGHGDGQNAYNLDPKPPDLGESLRQHEPSYWRAIIEGGTASVGRSPLCPPWGRTLAGSSVDDLVAYLNFLAKPDTAQQQ